MKRISELDQRKIAALSEFKSGTPQKIPKDENGFPEDRTLCPWCLNQNGGCSVCGGGGVVCPRCRGARILSGSGDFRPTYVGCPDCTDWPDQASHSWGGEGVSHNWPRFERAPAREIAAIEYYRHYKRQPECESVPVTPDGEEVADHELPF